MTFEVKYKDLLGRVGRFSVGNKILETPALLPVVNPRTLDIPPKELLNEFGYRGLMTNSYILHTHLAAEVEEKGVHRLLDYDGIIMTDSGAYQILRYGKVSISPLEILEFQKRIKTDIGVILDIPTGGHVTQSYAEYTVNKTMKRAEEATRHMGDEKVLWTGPVQGGTYIDLVAISARRMAKLPFDLYALGSPTEIMEQYHFDVLVEMVMAAKRNLPPQKPLHLFGAGHPLIFSFAVAMGCDLFDSAAYALFAKEDRYITETGTVKLKNLEYFPCLCPACRKQTPAEVKKQPKTEREQFLMRHNLYICRGEIDRVKQAVSEGRLWELLELRARAHPSLLTALQTLGRHNAELERHTPTYKPRGIFILGDTAIQRPEILSHERHLLHNYQKPKNAETLLLLPQTSSKPFHTSPEYKKVKKALRDAAVNLRQLHICFYTTPFGVVPIELDEIYPLSQFETVHPPTAEMRLRAVEAVGEYLTVHHYEEVLLHADPTLLDLKALGNLKKRTPLKEITRSRDPWSKRAISRIQKALKTA